MRLSKLITTLLLITTVFTSTIAIYAQFIEPRDMVYGFRVDLTVLKDRLGGVDIKPMYVSIIDDSRILVIGSAGDSGIAAILNIVDPYSDPIIEDMYPLIGLPTYIASDGYPYTRLAIGSSLGEILLFKTDNGRITKHLYTVLGADFYIDKIILARDSGGNIKIVVRTIEGGSRGYPCMNCHVYILDEEAQGILRMGPKVGNATARGRELEGIYIQDVAPLTIYGSQSFYWDASRVAIAYIPKKDIVTIVFNVTYVEDREEKPLPKTLVEVSIPGMPLYGVNADDRGVVRVPIPIERTRVTTANLTIVDLYGNILWRHTFTFDPKRYRVIPDEITLPSITLGTKNVDTTSAVKKYGTPEFLLVRIDFVDLTLAPFDYRFIGSAKFYLNPTIDGIEFLRGDAETRPKIICTDSVEGILGIHTLSIDGEIIRVSYTEDYIGTKSRIVSSISYSDGSYIAVGLSDGRIKVYTTYAQGYRLKYISNIGAEITNMISIPGVDGYTHVAVSKNGIQIYRIEPYPLPIYRNLASLYLTSSGYVHGSALASLKTIAIADQDSIIIIRNGNVAVRDRLALSMDRFMAKDIELHLAMPGDENINGTIVEFSYPNSVKSYKVSGDKETSIVLRNIIPNVRYTIVIRPPMPYIYEGSITFALRDRNIVVEGVNKLSITGTLVCCKLDVGLMYKEYIVKLILSDEITGSKLIARVDIYVDGKLVIESTDKNEHDLRLLYGSRNITIAPSKGFGEMYQPLSIVAYIDENKTLPISISRMRYPVEIKVIDRYSGKAPLVPINIDIAGKIYSITPIKHIQNITLPYGSYTMVLRPAEGFGYAYDIGMITIDVPKVKSYTATVNRTIYSIELILTDPYTGSLIAPVNVYLNDTLIIPSTTTLRHMVPIPYGDWIIKVAPIGGYEKVYNVYEKTIYINKSDTIRLSIDRAWYIVSVEIVDNYRRLIIPLNIEVSGPIKVTHEINPPGRTIELLLPYGDYAITVTPYNTSIYESYTSIYNINSNQKIGIIIQRVKYKIALSIKDASLGILRGTFELYVNGTKTLDNIASSAEIILPYGVYTLQLRPVRGVETVYEPSSLINIEVSGDKTIEIGIYRKTYNLRIVALEGATPIGNAVIYVYSHETRRDITQLTTNSEGIAETRLPYGEYRITVDHALYNKVFREYSIDRDISEVIYLEPKMTTLLWRYAPIIGVLIGVGIAVYVVMKIRTMIAKRLVEEEIF